MKKILNQMNYVQYSKLLNY